MKPQNRLECLDTIRGLAILMVFAFHCLNAVYQTDGLPWHGQFVSLAGVPKSFLLLLPATIGGVGVALFFAVSGFCIHLSFRKKPDWKEFVSRRFWRIYPPYLLALVLFTATTGAGWFQFWSHAGLVHNFWPATFFGINGSFWSIAVEVQLYAIYPLLLAMTGRWGWTRVLVGLGCVELVVRSLPGPQWLVFSPLGYWLSWSVGAWVAETYLAGEENPLARWPAWPLVMAAVGAYTLKPLSHYGFTVFAMLTAVAISKLLAGRWHAPGGRLVKHLQWAGVVSYSLYLVHQPLIRWGAKAMEATGNPILHHAPVQIAVLFASWFAIVALSGLLYRWVELPSIGMGKKRGVLPIATLDRVSGL